MWRVWIIWPWGFDWTACACSVVELAAVIALRVRLQVFGPDPRALAPVVSCTQSKDSTVRAARRAAGARLVAPVRSPGAHRLHGTLDACRSRLGSGSSGPPWPIWPASRTRTPWRQGPAHPRASACPRPAPAAAAATSSVPWRAASCLLGRLDGVHDTRARNLPSRSRGQGTVSNTRPSSSA